MPKKETKRPTKQSKPVETPEPPVVTIQVTNTQDSQPQPLTPFEVLQRRQQREAEK